MKKRKMKREIKGLIWAQDIMAGDISRLQSKLAAAEDRIASLENAMDRCIFFIDEHEGGIT